MNLYCFLIIFKCCILKAQFDETVFTEPHYKISEKALVEYINRKGGFSFFFNLFYFKQYTYNNNKNIKDEDKILLLALKNFFKPPFFNMKKKIKFLQATYRNIVLFKINDIVLPKESLRSIFLAILDYIKNSREPNSTVSKFLPLDRQSKLVIRNKKSKKKFEKNLRKDTLDRSSVKTSIDKGLESFEKLVEILFYNANFRIELSEIYNTILNIFYVSLKKNQINLHTYISKMPNDTNKIEIIYSEKNCKRKVDLCFIKQTFCESFFRFLKTGKY